jgi:hypothetical protein
MTIAPFQDVSFNDDATLATGEAFDSACESLRRLGSVMSVREIIAKRIIAAAANGERDLTRLYWKAFMPFGIENMSMVISVGHDSPIAAYALVTHAA